jgi:hypothetical protein
VEFYNDWKKDDFTIPILAQHDMNAMAEYFNLANKALSTSCGKALSERMKEAEWLLENVIDHASFIADPSAKSWLNRRDQWLKTSHHHH